MSSQIGSVSKWFPTVSTSKRFVPCVRPEVTLKKPRPGESLSTDLALVVEVMSEDMHWQGWHAYIHLPTHITLLGCVWVKCPVCLLVSGQVAAGCIVFTTLTTPVLWLEQIIAKHLILGPSITGKECFISVGCGLPSIQLKNSPTWPHRSIVRSGGWQGVATRGLVCSVWLRVFSFNYILVWWENWVVFWCSGFWGEQNSRRFEEEVGE